MTTIKQLQNMPVGTRVGGFDKTIKTAKKMWQVDDVWFQQVLLMDETGEMLADVRIGSKRIQLQRTQEIHITVVEIREGEKGEFLYIEQYHPLTTTEPPYTPNFTGDERVVRSKIKCWLIASAIQGNQINIINNDMKTNVNLLVDFIME